MKDIQNMLYELIGNRQVLLPGDFVKIASKSRVKRLKKGEHFVRAGDLNYNVCIVVKGLLRHYIIEENGDEKTIRFAAERSQSGSPDCVFNNMNSCEFVEALEDSILIVFDYRKMAELGKNNIRILRLQNKSLIETVSHNVQYIKFLNCFTPEQRYLSFSEQYPNLEKRIKQKHLASYLGITATSLSRMKARLHSNMD